MKTLELTGILIQDAKQGGFTSFLAEMPGVIAEGETEEEASTNLFDAFKAMLELQKEESINSMVDGLVTKEFPFNLALSQ